VLQRKPCLCDRLWMFPNLALLPPMTAVRKEIFRQFNLRTPVILAACSISPPHLHKSSCITTGRQTQFQDFDIPAQRLKPRAGDLLMSCIFGPYFDWKRTNLKTQFMGLKNVIDTDRCAKQASSSWFSDSMWCRFNLALNPPWRKISTYLLVGLKVVGWAQSVKIVFLMLLYQERGKRHEFGDV
jgi:hypothetical protein